ncbi:MAG TPA: amidohydrolase family protein [Bryobacteraceae bacterium]|nr:amidohydrolase family protein [Bryobacteraceae bacterium]
MKTLLVVTLFAWLGQAQTIAIQAGRIVDAAREPEAALNQVILVEHGKISAVGAGIPIPANATVIDLSKSTVLPGLFDAHTHLCTNMQKPRGGLNGTYEAILLETATKTTAYRALQGAANAREMLEAGFTTVRDVGNAGNYADSALRQAIDEGLIPGPTVINAGKIIAPYGGQMPGVLTPELRNIGPQEYLFADTHDELVKAIHENILYGAKVIKIVVDDLPYIYSAADIKFIVEEARGAGLKVAAHCLTGRGAHNAAEAGVASIEHGLVMSDDDLALAKRNGVTLVSTDLTKEYAEALGIPEFHAIFVERLKRAYKVGLPVVFGTDVMLPLPGKTRGQAAIAYIDSFVEAGVPPPAILQAMTTGAARLLGVEKERGAIRPGMAADLIATPDNPLENIQTLRKVTFVMKDGQVFRHN